MMDAPQNKSSKVRNRYVITSERIQIYVKTFTGTTIVLTVDQSDLIEHLKARIEEIVSIPVSCQRLIFAAKQLREQRTLSDYGVRRESTIYLFPRFRGEMKIFVENLGSDVSLDVEPLDTVWDVKCKLKSKQGIRPSQQELKLKNECLDDNRLLSDYNVQEKAKLDFTMIVPSNEKAQDALFALNDFVDSHGACKEHVDKLLKSNERLKESQIKMKFLLEQSVKDYLDSKHKIKNLEAKMKSQQIELNEMRAKNRSLTEKSRKLSKIERFNRLLHGKKSTD